MYENIDLKNSTVLYPIKDARRHKNGGRNILGWRFLGNLTGAPEWVIGRVSFDPDSGAVYMKMTSSIVPREIFIGDWLIRDFFSDNGLRSSIHRLSAETVGKSYRTESGKRP
jgi:hypothetical protein